MLSVIMLSVVKLNVIMLNIVAPLFAIFSLQVPDGGLKPSARESLAKGKDLVVLTST